jgi:hypothetical protein
MRFSVMSTTRTSEKPPKGDPLKKMPFSDGSWMNGGNVFRSKEGWLGVPRRVLVSNEENFSQILYLRWYKWLWQICPCLGRPLRGYRVRRPDARNRGYREWVTVWRLEDLELVIDRCVPKPGANGERELTQARKATPGQDGKWVDEVTWWHREHGACVRPTDLLEHLEKVNKSIRSRTWLDRQRRRKHPVLGGLKPFSARIPPLSPGRCHGRNTVVCCIAHYEQIDTEERRRLEQYPKNPPPGWQKQGEIAAALGVKASDSDLTNVLRLFRDECPDKADRFQTPLKEFGSGTAVRVVAFHDPGAFNEWLGDRTLREVAREMWLTDGPQRSRGANPSRSARLRKAIMFLWFALTEGPHRSRGAGTSKRGFVQLFNAFLQKPPYDDPPRPRGVIARKEILRLARWVPGLLGPAARGVDRRGRIVLPDVLYQARSKLGAKSTTGEKPADSGWKLPENYTPPRRPVDPSGQNTLEDGASAGKAKQTPPDPPPPPQLDGPIAPDGFRLGGKRVDGLPNLERKLLSFLWDDKRHAPRAEAVEIQKAIDDLYGENADDKDTAFVGVLKRLRISLKNLPASVRTKSSFIQLEVFKQG